jgi:hypothetical protein
MDRLRVVHHPVAIPEEIAMSEHDSPRPFHEILDYFFARSRGRDQQASHGRHLLGRRAGVLDLFLCVRHRRFPGRVVANLPGLFANVLLTLVVAVANMRHEAPRAKVAYLRKITAGKDGFQKAPVPDELYAEIDSLLRTEVLILQEFRDPAGDTLLYENVPARVRDVRSRLRQLTGRSSPTDAKKG